MTTDTRTDPATTEARCRRLMREHAATPKRPADNAEMRAALRGMIDAEIDAWLEAAEASCFDEVGP